MPWPKRDVFASHYQCFLWRVLPFSHVCAQNKIVHSEWKRKDSSSGAPPTHPRLFDPQLSQLFSITFKLLFTRGQTIDLKVWLSPPRFFWLLFVFKNTFQYYLFISQTSVQNICYCLLVHVWLFCLWRLRCFIFFCWKVSKVSRSLYMLPML